MWSDCCVLLLVILESLIMQFVGEDEEVSDEDLGYPSEHDDEDEKLMPESLSSEDPTESSAASWWGSWGSVLIPCSAKRDWAASLSPRWLLCLSL